MVFKVQLSSDLRNQSQRNCRVLLLSSSNDLVRKPLRLWFVLVYLGNNPKHGWNSFDGSFLSSIFCRY